MKYWVYINDKVVGPYDEDKLASLDGFTPDTLICPADGSNGGNQEWVKASSIFEFDQEPAPSAEVPAAQPAANATAAAAVDQSLAKLLIEKLDNLGQEIGLLKGKVDEAVAASEAAQEAAKEAAQQAATAATAAHTVVPAAVATTAPAEGQNTPKQQVTPFEGRPVDFLNEINIDEKSDEQGEDKGGEEVVLRSALDSLYMSKEQTEEEKEDTFQDLLSPFKEANTATAEIKEAAKEIAAENEKQAAQAETAAPAENPEEKVEVSEDKREEIINEITSADSQDNAVLQAIEDAQTNQPAEEEKSEDTKESEPEETAETKPEETAETETEEAPAQEPKAEEPVDEDKLLEATLAEELSQPLAEETLPVSEEPNAVELQTPVSEESAEEVTPLEKETAEKQALDLTTSSEQLTITNIPEDKPAVDLDPQLTESLQKTKEELDSALTPMDTSTDLEKESFEEKEETAQELVPGKKLEAVTENTSDEILSQADLDAAFEQQPNTDELQPPESSPESEIPQGYEQEEGNLNPENMTEVELKEGSTYLISDFIPPAVAGNEITSQNLPTPSAEESSSEKQSDETDIEEIVSTTNVMEEPKQEDEAAEKQVDDLTISQVSLENTIHGKRGASMDIKTVPMVQEPSDSDRLDLADSELDINAQHDLKTADSAGSSSKLTKVILAVLISIVCAAVIYVMLAYLEIIPAQFNLLKSAPAAQATVQDDTLSEMLVEDDMAAQELVEGAEATDPMQAILTEVKNYAMVNGQTLEQLINSRHAAAKDLIEWTITTAVEPDNYSILVKVPPENPQSFKISYRFNYNTVTKVLEPTISDSKNLLDSVQAK